MTKGKSDMVGYTQWAIEFPWHVSGDMAGKYPSDSKGGCTCTCKYCKEEGEHKATLVDHLRSKGAKV